MSHRIATSHEADHRSLTVWRSKLEEAKKFGHLEGSYLEAVEKIQNNDVTGLSFVFRHHPDLKNWIDSHDGKSLLAKAVFSKVVINDDVFILLIRNGCDAGLVIDQANKIPIVQHAICCGLSSYVILSMIAQPGNSICLTKRTKKGLVKVKNAVSSIGIFDC